VFAFLKDFSCCLLLSSQQRANGPYPPPIPFPYIHFHIIFSSTTRSSQRSLSHRIFPVTYKQSLAFPSTRVPPIPFTFYFTYSTGEEYQPWRSSLWKFPHPAFTVSFFHPIIFLRNSFSKCTVYILPLMWKTHYDNHTKESSFGFGVI
jgi:hypothetical protein